WSSTRTTAARSPSTSTTRTATASSSTTTARAMPGATRTADRCFAPTTSPSTNSSTEAESMYAQVIEGGTTLERRAEMDAIVTGSLPPPHEAATGCGGAMNLAARSTGNAMMIVLGESEEQATRPPPEYGDAFLRALAAITAISTGQRKPITVWDVNARE